MADDYVDADGWIRWIEQDGKDDEPGGPSAAPARGTRSTTTGPVAPRPVVVNAPMGGDAGGGLASWREA